MTRHWPDAWQRASDGEREEAVARLRAAFEEGRLDQEEHEKRVADAFAARTHGELQPVLTDLPAASGTRETAQSPDSPVSSEAPEATPNGSRLNPMAIWGIFAAVTFLLWVVPALFMGYPMGLIGWALFCGFWGIPAFAVTMSRRRRG